MYQSNAAGVISAYVAVYRESRRAVNDEGSPGVRGEASMDTKKVEDRRYIEIRKKGLRYLSDADLREIGEFTRDNVARWLDRHPDWLSWLSKDGGRADFRAFNGDGSIEIPWLPWHKHRKSVKAYSLNSLQVGQIVRMQSGDERAEVTVTEITEKYVGVKFEVWPARSRRHLGWHPMSDASGWRWVFDLHGSVSPALRYQFRFDRDGKQPEGDDPDFVVYEMGIDCLLGPRPLCGKSGQPWELRSVLGN
jgi:hypothetical protein